MDEKDYYIVRVESCVEPVLIGPLEEEEASERIEEYNEDPAHVEDIHFIVTVDKGAEVDV